MTPPIFAVATATVIALLAATGLNAQNLTNFQPPNYNMSVGQPCNIGRNRLTSTAHQFLSACVATAYCDPTAGVCKPKGCKSQRFPFGYRVDADTPPLCPSGQFCPDEGDQCLPVQPVGQNCQMDRDDQCEPAPNAAQIASSWNNQGAICLEFVCYWQNQTLGNPCVVDNNVYIGFRGNGSQWADIVSRDNCQSPGLYCDSQSLVCKQALDLGEACQADKQCLSRHCGIGNVCVVPAGTVKQIPIYQYVLTGAGIIILMVVTLVSLFFIHRRNRAARQREIREYFHEQTTYRSSIIALHTAARERTASIYSDSRATLSQYDEHGQMIYRDDESSRNLIGNRRQSRLRDSMIAEDDDDSDEERAQGKALLYGGDYSQSRLSLAQQETPRQSFDYASGSGSGGYAAVPMRQSVDLPRGAGVPQRPGQTDSPFKDPWEGR